MVYVVDSKTCKQYGRHNSGEERVEFNPDLMNKSNDDLMLHRYSCRDEGSPPS